MTGWPSNLTLRPIDDWPGEQTRRRERSNFSAPNSATLTLLKRELHYLAAKNVVLQVALREQDFKINGEPKINARATHPGVILALDSKYGPLRYPCDTFIDWWDNLRAIALALEALRKVDRYGVTKRAEQYRGWQQIEGTPSGERPMDRAMARKIILDVLPGGEASGLGFDEMLRRAKAAAHPDRHNGDRHLWDNVEQAARVLGLAS